jgi:hypothetical protein
MVVIAAPARCGVDSPPGAGSRSPVRAHGRGDSVPGRGASHRRVLPVQGAQRRFDSLELLNDIADALK